jgi:hypothetical protein
MFFAALMIDANTEKASVGERRLPLMVDIGCKHGETAEKAAMVKRSPPDPGFHAALGHSCIVFVTGDLNFPNYWMMHAIFDPQRTFCARAISAVFTVSGLTVTATFDPTTLTFYHLPFLS